jgi:hypothetical protein
MSGPARPASRKPLLPKDLQQLWKTLEFFPEFLTFGVDKQSVSSNPSGWREFNLFATTFWKTLEFFTE